MLSNSQGVGPQLPASSAAMAIDFYANIVHFFAQILNNLLSSKEPRESGPSRKGLLATSSPEIPARVPLWPRHKQGREEPSPFTGKIFMHSRWILCPTWEMLLTIFA